MNELRFRVLKHRHSIRPLCQSPHRRRPSKFTPRCYHYQSGSEESCDIKDNSCFFIDLGLQEAKIRLAEAVNNEDYTDAARLRDQVIQLELTRRSLTVAALKPKNIFPVGTTMRHRVWNYRGVIVGYDASCMAPESWKDQMRVRLLANGPDQPFYHVLVDVRDRPGGQITYVAQENIVPSRTPCPVDHPLVSRYLQVLRASDGKSWTYLPKSDLRECYPFDF